MFCRHCGTEIKAGANFCTGCGTPLDKASLTSESSSGFRKETKHDRLHNLDGVGEKSAEGYDLSYPIAPPVSPSTSAREQLTADRAVMPARVERRASVAQWGITVVALLVAVALGYLSFTLYARPFIISTVAGNGVRGFSGDGGPATAALLTVPVGIAVGADGSLYIADPGKQCIRKITPNGIISTVAGNGASDFGSDGGPATAAQLDFPTGIAVGADGSLYIADSQNRRIRRVSPNGIISTVAGNGVQGFSGDGGPATAAQLNTPVGIAVAADGSLYIADSVDSRIRQVSPNGIISTLAGNGVRGFGGDGGPATTAQLAAPMGIAVGADGSLYIADSQNRRIRRVTPNGIISTVAGNGVRGFGGDGGPATAAQLNALFSSIAVAADGSLYIADSENHRIRRVSPNGIISTVAGNGVQGFSGDGGPATAAQLNTPVGIAVAADGSLYIADSENHRIRRVSS